MLFFRTMLTIFIAEMGDKTQFLLIAFASKYKLKDIILGTAAAVMFLNVLAVGIGSVLNNVLPVQYIKLTAGLAFLYFAYIAVFGNEKEEQGEKDRKGKRKPVLSVFGTFFIAELGDKTQLTALTFAASEGIRNAFTVFLACSAGLFSADMIGLAIGYFLKSKLPCRLISYFTYGIFTVFGIINIHQVLHMYISDNFYIILVTCAVSIAFGLISLYRLLYQKNRRVKICRVKP